MRPYERNHRAAIGQVRNHLRGGSHSRNLHRWTCHDTGHFQAQTKVDLQLQLCSPPVSPLGIVADGVSSPHPDPLRDWPILLHFLGQNFLDAERFESRHDGYLTSFKVLYSSSVAWS